MDQTKTRPGAYRSNLLRKFHKKRQFLILYRYIPVLHTLERVLINKALRILILTDSLVLIAGAMLGPLYAFFVDKVGGDLLDASLAIAVFSLATGVTILLMGEYLDKSKRHELVIVAGYVIMGLGYILYLFVSNIWMLLAVQVLIGFGEAIYAPAFDALYSLNIDEEHVGKEWAAWESVYYFSLAIGAVVGGFIVSKVGFSAVFVIMAILCFISAFYVFHLKKSFTHADKNFDEHTYNY